MATIQEAFGVNTINRVITTFADNTPHEKLTPLFVNDDTAEGDVYQWEEFEYSRNLAPVTGPSTGSKALALSSRGLKSTTLAHIKVHKTIDARRLFITERGLGVTTPDAASLVAREIKSMMVRVQKTIERLAAMALHGSISVSSATIEDSDVTFTVTYAVQTFTATASWATSSTKILSGPAELPKLKDDYFKTAGHPLSTLIFNQSVTNYLMGNTEVQSWVQHTARGVEIFDVGMIDQMAGLTWVQYDGNYKDALGTVQKYIEDDKIIGLPDAATRAEYLKMARGYGIVPKSAIGAQGELLAGLAPQRGFYGYTTLFDDPVALKTVVGWVGLPVITFPSIVVVGDTTP